MKTGTATSKGPRAHVQLGIGREKHRVVIVGGGTAGITTAARLTRAFGSDIVMIEPADHHFYQPLWTLVGAGVVPKEKTIRSEQSVIPKGVRWVRDRVVRLKPDANLVETESGRKIGYDFLVVAPGVVIDWDGVKGLAENLGRNGVCSIYGYEEAETAWSMLNSFEGGNAVFTSPATPIKCGGAPMKIMWMADDLWRKNGLRDRTTITFATAGTVIFGVPGFRETLEKMVVERDLRTLFRHHLIEIRGRRREAVVAPLVEDENETVLPYDLLHVTPPMHAPVFVRRSPLAHQEGPSKGWLNVDIHTLQNPDYPNVFGLGDVAALPTAKTGAAVRKQAPIVVSNIQELASGGQLDDADKHYDGYSSCPIVTGYGRAILAEFGYENEPMPTFPIDQTKERRSMYWLKRYGLPWMYWHLMLKGKA